MSNSPIIYGGTSSNGLLLTPSGTAGFLKSDAVGNISIAAATGSAPTYNYTSQTGAYNAAANDWVRCGSASFAVTLPTAVGVAGEVITVQHASTSLAAIFAINTTSGQNISIGGANFSSGQIQLYTNGETFIFMSDGSQWRAMEHYASTTWTSGGTTAISSTSSYVFTVTAANATIGTIYTNSGFNFIVTTTIAAGVTLTCSGTGTPATSGTLTKVGSGAGDATITFASRTITGVPVKGAGVVMDLVNWRREGNFADLTYTYEQTTTAGTAGVGDYIFFLPTNMYVDTTNLTAFRTAGVVITATASTASSMIPSSSGAVLANTSVGISPIMSLFNEGLLSSGLPSSFRVALYNTAGPVSATVGAANFAYSAPILQLYFSFRIPISGWQP